MTATPERIAAALDAMIEPDGTGPTRWVGPLQRALAAQGLAIVEAPEQGTLDWRAKIAAAEEWIGWDTTFCYWCGQTIEEGHATDCTWVAARLATDAGEGGNG